MNHGNNSALKPDDQNPTTTKPTSLGTASPSLPFIGRSRPKDHAMKTARGLMARDQVDAAIDQWAESLVAIIEASDNPEASLLRAHLAIAIKHNELETLARREL